MIRNLPPLLLVIATLSAGCPDSPASNADVGLTSNGGGDDAGTTTDVATDTDAPDTPRDARTTDVPLDLSDGLSDGLSDDTGGPDAPTHVLEPTCPQDTPGGGEAWDGWANLQFPRVQELETGEVSEPIYGQVFQNGVTDEPGQAPGWESQLVVGPLGAHPERTPACFRTLDAAYNVDDGNNDEYWARVSSERAGLFSMYYRFRPPGGAWRYGDLGGSDDGTSRDQASVLAVDDPQGPAEIRAISLNLGCRTGEWATRIDLVIDALAELDPHLVGFQEDCAETDGEPQSLELLERLADRLDRGYEVFRLDTHRAAYPEGEFDEGISLMTALPIELHYHVDLPYENFARKLLVVDVRLGSGDLLRFANAHFDDGPNDDLRAQSALLVTEQRDPEIPMVVTGDFNATPDSAAYTTMTETFDDAWVTANPGTDGFTFPSDGPDRRIDYAFTSDLTVDSAQLVDREEAGLHLSEHLGVAVTLVR